MMIDPIIITTELARWLVDQQFPQWSQLDISPVARSGHDNRTFHLGEAMSLRLPSSPAYAAQVEKEARWLPVLTEHVSLPISAPIAMGRPTERYPLPWSVNRYLSGMALDQQIGVDPLVLAEELSTFLRELQQAPTQGAPTSGEHNFFRGSSPRVYDRQVQAVLAEAGDLATEAIQVFRERWTQAIQSDWSASPVWLHGDIAPGNLLIRQGHLCGVIDFGIMGVGDPACDYAMAWTWFPPDARRRFLQGLDAGTIYRARGWALWKALITRQDENPQVAASAVATLDAILEEYRTDVKGGNHMPNTPRLTTGRLILRRFTEADLEALYDIYRNEEVNTFLPWFPLRSMEEAAAFYRERYASAYEQPRGYRYAVCLAEEDRPIGYVHLSTGEGHDLGYGLLPEFWRRGIVTEAARAVVEQARRDGIPYITATHDVKNPRSGRVMQALGMRYCYTYREQWQPKDIPVDFRMYQLNLDENSARVYRGYWDRYAEHWVETV